MIVCIAGGREGSVTSKQISDALEAINFNPERDEIVQGGAKGIDSDAAMYCLDRGIPCEEYKADWDNLEAPDAVIRTNKFGKRYNAKAGHDRNALMAQDADVLILF